MAQTFTLKPSTTLWLTRFHQLIAATSLVIVFAYIPVTSYSSNSAVSSLAKFPQSQPPSISLPPLPTTNTNSPPPPQIQALSAIVVDQESGKLLYELQPDLPLPPASTTKIMTALVAMDTYNLDETITVTQEELTLGQTMNLYRGEQLTVQDLLYGTLIASGNDAALALATAYPHGGYAGFISAMNLKARHLHLDHTSYKNVSGLNSLGHYTTARDLANLTRYAVQRPLFRHIVSTPKHTVTSIDGQTRHDLHTTNQLLGKLDGVFGVKTGWTEAAGECLVASVTREGHTIITVVLNSPDRFIETTHLINWAFSAYTWTPIYPP